MTAQTEASAASVVRAVKLIERGHVQILEADRTGRCLAHVRSLDGDEVYRVACTPTGRWSCSCQASRWNVAGCSHRAAVRLVV
jgi:hypothetical protein